MVEINHHTAGAIATGSPSGRRIQVEWGQVSGGVTPIPASEAARALGDAAEQIKEQLGRRIVGMGDVVDHVLISLFSGGHCLLVGVPGLAKTLLVSSLAELLSLDFARIQFTPDLMPSDITGTEVLIEDRATRARRFEFMKGPVFAHLVLADEINRTPPKTQAALLEAMEERQVTSAGRKHSLDAPFFVLATQNPIEQEGTYPLPVSQTDRFMFKVVVDYPSFDEEYRILRLTVSRSPRALDRVLERTRILQLISAARALEVDRPVLEYATRLARAARPGPEASAEVRDWVQWGPGPRGIQNTILGAKARALLRGRQRVLPEDVRAVLPATLRHRLLLNYHAEVDGITTEHVIAHLLDTVGGPDRRAPSKALARHTSRA